MNRGNLNQRTVLSPAKQKYMTSRMNVLVAIAFTLVNIVLAITGSGTSFLFSIQLPYLLVLFGSIFGGKFPTEFYDEMYELSPELKDVIPINGLFVAFLVIALVIIAAYVLLFYLSKKKPSAMIALLVLFSADILIDVVYILFFSGISIASLIDAAFHAWVLYYLVIGAKCAKEAFNEEPIPEVNATEVDPEESDGSESANTENEKEEPENADPSDETPDDNGEDK